MRSKAKFFAGTINAFIIFLTLLMCLYSVYLPDSFYVSKGNNLELSCIFNIEADNNEMAVTSSHSEDERLSRTTNLKLLGIIPIKEVNVEEIDRPVLIAGGNPFGIKLLTEGVMVIGIGTIEGTVAPAAVSGIKKGDILISVDGHKVKSNNDIGKIISKGGGKKVSILINRHGEEMELTLQPKYSREDCCYKAGIWVRDSTAGIGTITYYNPATKEFGGLGHPVCDVDTGAIVPISSGEAVGVHISDVKKGKSGEPGELIGSFSTLIPIGTLDTNKETGIYGFLRNAPNHSVPLPMALKQEVKTGDAYIYTTVSGSEPKAYKIEIEKIDLNENKQTKNMIIKVTDPALLEQTGGIVQGMSGSPIIQNGKIVGAVTHVFVNNSTKGYGIFIENMVDKAA